MAKGCHKYIEDLNGFLDGDLDDELCQEIEEHIGQCNNCRIMVDTMRQTVSLCREGRREDLPKALENKLSAKLRERWNKKFGK